MIARIGSAIAIAFPLSRNISINLDSGLGRTPLLSPSERVTGGNTNVKPEAFLPPWIRSLPGPLAIVACCFETNPDPVGLTTNSLGHNVKHNPLKVYPYTTSYAHVKLY